MRAADFLTLVSKPMFTDHFTSIWLFYNQQLWPVTTLTEKDGRLILSHVRNQPPLSVKTFYTQLMLHRTLSLYCLKGADPTPVFGYREEGTKIII